MEMKLREEELRQLSDRDLEKHIMQVSSLHQQLLVDTG
jgi:ribosomal protein L29